MPAPNPARLRQIASQVCPSALPKVNDLFEGDLTDNDKLVYVNNALKGRLLESNVLIQQTRNNTKEQFANSPDLSQAILEAVMDALGAHQTMSKQALDSEKVRAGLKDILLGPAMLYKAPEGAALTHQAFPFQISLAMIVPPLSGVLRELSLRLNAGCLARLNGIDRHRWRNPGGFRLATESARIPPQY